MSGVGENAREIAYWNDVRTAAWTELQAETDRVFAGLTEAAVAHAAPAPGERVLDVGCGCGDTVLRLAGRVGAAGQVVGVDVSEGMLARARARIASAALPRAALLRADAALPAFRPGSFDLVFSRFGVMFFRNPVRAFAELRASLAPSGRLVFLCWRPLAENPWFGVPLAAVRPFVAPVPAPVSAAEPEPGPFAFADPARLRRVLGEAGWSDVAIAPLDAAMPLSPSGDVHAATEFARQIGPAAAAMAGAEPSARAAAARALAEALALHRGAEGIALGGAVWMVSARA